MPQAQQRRRATAIQSPTPSYSLFERFFAAGIVLLPLFAWPTALDAYRLPKALLFRAIVIVLGALTVSRLIRSRDVFRGPLTRFPARHLLIAIVLWSGVTAIFAARPLISLQSFIWVLECAVFFAGACIAWRTLSARAVLFIIVPAALCSIACILGHVLLQSAGSRIAAAASTGFFGNADDLGSYLVAPLVIAVSAAPVLKSPSVTGLAVLIGAGIIVNGSLTAIAAAGMSTAAIGIRFARPSARYIVVIGLVGSVACAFIYLPTRNRIGRAYTAFSHGQYNDVITFRATALISAWNMFLDHPLTGVGPGCFGWEYFRYKIEAEMEHPVLRSSAQRSYSFGEAHSDLLQIPATTGFPGALLLIASVLAVAATSLYRSTDAKLRIASLAGFPLAIAFVVTASMLFPLELAGAAGGWLTVASLLVSWRGQ